MREESRTPEVRLKIFLKQIEKKKNDKSLISNPTQ